MGRLDDKTAIITGAGGGIGYAYAERFLDEGANVVIAEIEEASGEKAAAALAETYDGRVTFVATDITDEDSTVACAAAANEQFGSVDILFGPEPPAERAENWIQTMPGKGWFVILRLYGPLEPWFDQSWKPGDVERV